MNRSAGITLAALMLALGLWSMTAYSADDDEAKAIKEAQQDIKKLVEAMKAKNGKVKGQVQAIAKKFDEVKPVMMVYKSRKKGGIGMGKDGENDIEITIGKIGNPRAKGWSGSTGNKKRLDARKDLAMVADLSRALAEVSELYAKKYNDSKGKPNPKLWKQYVDKMRKGADELDKAAKGNDAVAIQKAAANLTASCSDCHGEFRQ